MRASIDSSTGSHTWAGFVFHYGQICLFVTSSARNLVSVSEIQNLELVILGSDRTPWVLNQGQCWNSLIFSYSHKAVEDIPLCPDDSGWFWQPPDQSVDDTVPPPRLHRHSLTNPNGPLLKVESTAASPNLNKIKLQSSLVFVRIYFSVDWNFLIVLLLHISGSLACVNVINPLYLTFGTTLDCLYSQWLDCY